MVTAYYTIIYDHPNQSSYKGIKVLIKSDADPAQTIDFATGDPIIDWWQFVHWAGSEECPVTRFYSTREFREWIDLSDKWIEKWMSSEDGTVYTTEEALLKETPDFYQYFMPIICTARLITLQDIKDYVRIHTVKALPEPEQIRES